jgi:hypothetical protein
MRSPALHLPEIEVQHHPAAHNDSPIGDFIPWR